MESGSDLTVLIAIISTGVAIIVALFAFGVFFLRRLDTVARDMRTEMRAEVQNLRTDLGSRIDGVNGRVDQMILAMGLPAFQQAAASAEPACPTEQPPSAA